MPLQAARTGVAYALLGAVTDGPTQLRAYGELIGTGSAAADD